MAYIVFASSEALRDYIRVNNKITWHGDLGIGSLEYIDSPSLHVVFHSRKEYDDFRSCKKDCQIVLF